MRPGRTSAGIGGFTLIEILIVIAVVAVLIGILLPALGRARESARLLGCVSNVRSQGQLVALYASEHGGAMPPRLYWRTFETGAGAIQSERALVNSFLASWAGEPFPFENGLAFATPTGVWRCPDSDGEGATGTRATHNGELHHAPNQFMFGFLDLDETTGYGYASVDAVSGWNARYGGRGWTQMHRFGGTSDLIMLMDNVSTWIVTHSHIDAREFYRRAWNVPTDPFSDGVLGTANENTGSHQGLGRRPAVFADGHAESMPDGASYWQGDAGVYRARGTSIEEPLYESEVRHLMWFVERGERVRDHE
jgi:prepilin-type N-terminal cleavage/methylation domain-containing protein